MDFAKLKRKQGRRESGKQAKRNGDSFENLFINCCAKNRWHVIKIPTGCRVLGPKKIQMVKTPFDFMCAKDGTAFFCDAKTTDTKNFAYSQIEIHQMLSLLDLEETGHKAGYVVRFTAQSKVVFYSATQLAQLKPRESLSIEDGIILGDPEDINLSRVYQHGPQEEEKVHGRATPGS